MDPTSSIFALQCDKSLRPPETRVSFPACFTPPAMESRLRLIPLARWGALRLLLGALLCRQPLLCRAAPCELGVLQNGNLYNYSLALPSPKHPHGVLSEDGFYKVAANGTFLWFQLCANMLFNHDPPKCFNCQDCGGSLRCGTQCSALVSNDIGGYPVCSSIGQASKQHLALIDKRYPNKGVKVMLSTNVPKNCSLSVSIFCDPNGAKGPDTLEIVDACSYATSLKHPSACPKIISGGGGTGWFGTLLLLILCLLLAYILVGVVYRFYYLGIRGLDVIPNLEFWLGLPERGKVFVESLLRRIRGPSHRNRSSYASIN